MKQTFLSLILLLSLSSWKVDIKGPWIISESKRIVLHTRPLNYSKTNSPDSLIIHKIIQEQENVIDYINAKLNTDFNSKFDIYLFNFDEAKEKIGTDGGGSCDSKGKTLYFAFFRKPVFNTIRKELEYIGVHEAVHIVSTNLFGSNRTRFFSEGYANAIDGNYGSIKTDSVLVRRTIDFTFKKIQESNKINTPTELLYNDKIPAGMYYPQVGCLFRWLFKEYGLEKMNKLYSINKNKIEKEFLIVTNESFKEMERKYLAYIGYQK